MWTTLEAHIAIICCTIPTLRPFIKQVLPGFLTSSMRTGPRTTGASGGLSGNFHSRNHSIPLGSVLSKNHCSDDDYSSSTEQFAGPTTDIEGGFHPTAGNGVARTSVGIFKRTEVNVVSVQRPGRDRA